MLVNNKYKGIMLKGTDPGADAAVAIVYSTDFLGAQQHIAYSATVAAAVVHIRPFRHRSGGNWLRDLVVWLESGAVARGHSQRTEIHVRERPNL
jgi:hypothetical protein